MPNMIFMNVATTLTNSIEDPIALCGGYNPFQYILHHPINDNTTD